MISPFHRRTRQRPQPVQDLQAGHGRVLAWGTTTSDEPVIATVEALVIGGEAPLRLPWHLVDKAVWAPPAFDIRYRDERTKAPRRLRVELTDRGDLPPVVRERVTRSVVISRRVALEGDLGAVLAARRDEQGAIGWTVTFDPGLDARDPHLQQLAREALAELRDSYGA